VERVGVEVRGGEGEAVGEGGERRCEGVRVGEGDGVVKSRRAPSHTVGSRRYEGEGGERLRVREGRD
jgi:hypothetical protein